MTSSINFPWKVFGKNFDDKIELFNVTFVTIGFTLFAINLIILTINSFKISMILGIVIFVAAKFSHEKFFYEK